MSLAFTALLTANRTRHVRFYAPEQRPWTDTEWVLAIGGEAGEACNIIKKLQRAQQGMAGNGGSTIETLTQDLGAELADVVIYAVVVAGLKRHILPWRDFRGLRKAARGQRDNAITLPSLGCELLWWVGTMAVTDGTQDTLTSRQIEGLILAAADLADVVGIDLGAAVVEKFNTTSEKLGFPERL